MALRGCYVCLKYLVVVFNLIYWLLGVLIVVGALLFMSHGPTYIINSGESEKEYTAGMSALIAVGVVLVVLGFLGCCGAVRESPCMLATFFVFLLLIVIGELAGGTTVWSHAEPIKATVKRQLTNLIQVEYTKDPDDFFTKQVDSMQRGFQCCGINEPKDWANSKYNGMKVETGSKLLDAAATGIIGGVGAYSVPASCCAISNPEGCEAARFMMLGGAATKTLYTTGCLPAIWEGIKLHAAVAGGVMVLVVALQIMGLLFTLLLCCAVRREGSLKD